MNKKEKAAYWSIWWFASSLLFSLISFVYDPNKEDFITIILLSCMVYVEVLVKNWFRQWDARGSIYGYINQTAFALLFVVYGIYHYMVATVPIQVVELFNNPDIEAAILLRIKVCYLVIGVGAGIGQYMLGRFYLSSSNETQSSS